MNHKRVRVLKQGTKSKGPVAYWMSRDQRVYDNWALIYSQEVAIETKSPLVTIFCVTPKFIDATLRQYDFMIKNLKEVQSGLAGKDIPFFVAFGLPEKEIPAFIKKYDVALLVTDFDPLRIKKEWKQRVCANIEIPFHEVDAHNIVPCWIASSKQEYGAYTIRPKINRQIAEFLDEFPPLKTHPFPWKEKKAFTDWAYIIKNTEIDRTVMPVDWILPGERAASENLEDFLSDRIMYYTEHRNNPNKRCLSNLSPYIHFGHISAQRAVMQIQKAGIPERYIQPFLEELVVRRELSDNYCFYNQRYDNFEGFPEWAKRTLNEHRLDTRPYIYTIEQFEYALTHDKLWNAAQNEMVKTGKMHGYMRMYWAKKILEWSESPEEAIETAMYLNDRYELDGRDPNGYTGIAWSMGGVHDRAWNQRNVFGKIRYMSYNGCRAKFNVSRYIEHVGSL